MRTYTSVGGGLVEKLKQARTLYAVRTRNIPGEVRNTIGYVQRVRDRLEKVGCSLRGKRVLIVGAGQTLREVYVLGLDNRVTGIDLDVVPQGLDLAAYVALVRENGWYRAAKTAGRKLLGIDRKFREEMKQQLGSSKLGTAELLQMDASKLDFPDASFDVIYSFSVFEHLSEPAAVLKECKRVLKPGGVLYVSLHLYSAEGGCHDLRIFSGNRAGIPWWAHLRPAQQHLVQEDCYMNKWRLSQWRALWAAETPGHTEFLDHHADPLGSQLVKELAQLRAAGELAEYTDEDLLVVNQAVVWRKPTPATA